MLSDRLKQYNMICYTNNQRNRIDIIIHNNMIKFI